MIAKGITVGLLQENCYIVGCEKQRVGVVIDPGDSAHAIMRLVKEMGLTIEKIINTHAHFDHCLGSHGLAEALRAPAGMR